MPAFRHDKCFVATGRYQQKICHAGRPACSFIVVGRLNRLDSASHYPGLDPGLPRTTPNLLATRSTTLQPSRQFPPVFIEIAENEIRLAAVSFELAEFGDPH